MQSSSFLHKARTVLKQSYSYLKVLARNRYFWGGFAGLMVVAFAGYLLINHLIMPAFTRHDVTVRVPDVLNQSFEAATRTLEEQDLRVEKLVYGLNPDLPRDVIVDQTPPPNAIVKPGRRVYLTVNAGEIPMVSVPRVEEISLREAEARLQGVGLTVKETRPDSIPSPHPNTVTRQEPAAGEMIPKGSSVTLWYSTGRGESYVNIPDVTGITVAEAEEVLLRRKLRSVVLGLESYDGLGEPIVLRQSPAAGTSMREGSEIRLFIKDE